MPSSFSLRGWTSGEILIRGKNICTNSTDDFLLFRWVYLHQFSFLKALLFVMMDLTGEVSSGAVDMAKANLEKMLTLCAAPIDDPMDGGAGAGRTADLKAIQDKSLQDVIHELVRQVTSPNSCVREQAQKSLRLLAQIQGRTVTQVMEPHRDVLQVRIHLLLS